MTPKTKNTNTKRPSKSKRTYERRMKQTARKDGTVYRSPGAHRVSKKVGE